ncbi:MAG: site-specific integrase [Nitrososphaerota archaeon]|jgi:integrase|nr:site-specific integrase [Nitrososphaerota archaeon]MDG6927843.1 site-specific integrase [Nitrososphaerota archaeon]MDG6931271.1 site-specific integrase [Nitrososphaerota archaeon]MDG6932138.1 site-specific integrase [Nitrososphaerota archaeon]MDG6936163.1 site-specific integrase [Nitrososphaerota archaeon]
MAVLKSKEEALEIVKESISGLNGHSREWLRATEQFMLYLYATGKEGNTILSYKQPGMFLFKYLLDHDKPVEQVDEIDIENMFAGTDNLKPQSRLIYAKRVLSFLNWIRGRAKLPLLSLRYVALPRPDKNSVDDQLKDENVYDMLNLIRSPRIRLAVFLMFKLGMRETEVLGLTYDSITTVNGKTVFTLRHKNGGYGAKGQNPDKSKIWLSSFHSLGLLDDKDIETMNNLFNEVHSRYGDTDRIIGLKYESSIQNALAYAGYRIGLKFRMHPHLLRHHFIVKAALKRIPINVAASLVRDDMETLMKYYMTFAPDLIEG